MRRIAPAALILAATLAVGCGQPFPVRNVGVGRTDPAVVPASADETGAETSVPRLSRQAVPDAVMLRNQADAGYQDTPAPPPF